MTNWQDIATAPRDGRLILAVGRLPEHWAVIRWEAAHDCWACAWDNWPMDDDEAVTHWAPLPDPPNTPQNKSDG